MRPVSRFVNCAFSALIYEAGPGNLPAQGAGRAIPDNHIQFEIIPSAIVREIAPRSHDLRIRIDDFADSKRAFSSKRVKEEDGGGFDPDSNPQIAKSGADRDFEGSL